MSYFHKVGKSPLIYRTLGQHLSLIAEQDGDREAFHFVEENKKFTYEELLCKADRLAAGLQCLGLKKGDCVCILAPNVSVWPIALYAAARAGLVSVPLNPTYEPQDIEKCIKKVSAKILIASEFFGSSKYYDKLLEIIPELKTFKSGYIQSNKLPFLSTIIIDSENHYSGTLRLGDVMSLPTLCQINNIKKQQDDLSPDSVCNIQFTSGFTGSPKAVLISHLCVINTGFEFGRCELQNSKICLPLQFCHLFALTVIVAASCYRGTIIGPSYIYDAEKTLHAIAKESCEVLIGMPPLFMDLVSKQKVMAKNKYDIKSLTIGVTGGTPCFLEQYNQIKTDLGLEKLKIVYGMTEIGMGFSPLPEDADEETRETVGCVADHTEVKVMDSNGMLVPLGTSGELYIRGYGNMIGYLGDEEKTKEVLDTNRWFRTGDYFILQQNGYGKILGRMNDIINKDSQKIFPKEIENLLATCPKVAEACVLGVPDKDLGEELCAFVTLRDELETLTSEDIFRFCYGKIEPFKIPRYVYAIKEFPKTLSGKIKKLELKDYPFIKK